MQDYKGPVSIYHLEWVRRMCNSPYMNFVHPPPGLPSFLFEPAPPLKQPEFFLPPPDKRKKEKETETPTLALLHSTDMQTINLNYVLIVKCSQELVDLLPDMKPSVS